MRWVLITGMSGVGKSSVVAELARRGHRAVDLDHPDWSHHGPAGDWRWREDRVAALLGAEDGGVAFVSGTAENQSRFRAAFSAIVLLSAPAEVIIQRLRDRDTNDYGKRPEEVAETLGYLETVEPLLRASADHEIDATEPLGAVVDRIIAIAAQSGM